MTTPSSLDLAVIGNCQVAALVDTRARIVWACWPRPDGDPVFCALLTPRDSEPELGAVSTELRDQVGATQEYLRNTAIVATTLSDAEGGEVRVTDYCPRFRSRGRMFRPSAIVRLIEPLHGRPLVTVRVRPTAEYGAKRPAVTSGSHHIRFASDSGAFRLTTNASLSDIQEGRAFVLDHPIALLIGTDEPVPSQVELLARDWLASTHDYWCDWVRTLAVPFDWQRAVIRAAITLKLCTYEDTGAVLAALTTSIPEASGTERNWDYRFCWLRDAFFVVQALNRLGATRTMEGFLRFIESVIAQGSSSRIQPVYRIAGTEALDEHIASGLAGYRGLGPVRIGNAAAIQQQHDVYGSIVLATSQLFFDERLTKPGDSALFGRLEWLGNQAVLAFGQPDAGPWEFRGVTRPHTFSSLMCWATCDRLSRVAEVLGLSDQAASWAAQASRMRAELIERAWSERRGAFVGALDGQGEIDATGLLMAELGLVAPNDPRFLATLTVVERELVASGYVMRYRHADDFGLPTNAFLGCSFWLVNSLARAGRRAEAIEHFNAVLARCNHVGLLSEDVDPRTGELWGNFPQTYSMVGAINSAIRLSRPWEAA